MASETETQSSISAVNARETLTGYASRTYLVVGTITILALLARFFALGARTAHQDEARVAYWAYRYMESGVYWYRPIVHGPFLTLVDSYVFELFGASDFTMRAIVALLGGLLPLSALLFRERLRDSETVAVALFLAVNPILLYYSRFYRNDLLLAGFMLAAFGFFVRAYDHRRPAFLYAGTAIFALAFTTKENALVYPVCWAGAAFLLWDRRMLTERPGERSAFGAVYDYVRGVAAGVWNWAPHFALAVVEFFAIFVFFYAPRGAEAEASPTLGQTLSDPTLLPALVEEAVIGSWHAFTGQWGGGAEESYLSTFESLWPVMQEGAIVVLALALVGFLYDRYGRDGPRDVVAFAFFWGFFSVLGYPVIVDNPFPWEVVHVVAPLVIPAAVGLMLVVRLGLESAVDGDAISATAALLVLLLVVGQVGATAVGTSYLHPQSPDNELVQYAQSSSDVGPVLREVRSVVNSNGPNQIDVMFYGQEFYAPNEDSHLTPKAGQGWFARLPFAWYLETYGAEVDSTTKPELLQGGAPPVVIAFGQADSCDETYDHAGDIDQYLDGYERHEVQRYAYDSGCTISTVVVFVDESATNGTQA